MPWFGLLIQLLISWLTLLLAGRLFDKMHDEAEVTWKEDASAALLVVLITGVVYIAASFVGLPPESATIVYIALIFFAFQLEGIHDAITFYLIHGLMNAIVSIAVIAIGVDLPLFTTSSAGMGGGAGGF